MSNTLYQKNVYKTIVIGAGAGGLFFGASCPAQSDVLILEKKKQAGIKLLMSGAGKCNLTHAGSIKEFLLHYGSKGKKIRSCLYTYNNLHLCKFIENLGLPLWEREDGKIFPRCMDATQVRDALLASCSFKGVTIKTEQNVTKVSSTPFGYRVVADKIYECENLVIAVGGASYPTTGSDGVLLNTIVEDFHLPLVPLRPALTPVFVENYGYSQLSGMSFSPVSLQIFSEQTLENKKETKFVGDLLFTHKNLSGPVILDHSRDLRPGDKLEINYLFPYTMDMVVSDLKKHSAGNSQQIVTYLLQTYNLPKRFISHRIAEIGLENKKLSSFSGKELSLLGKAFCQASYRVSKLGDFGQAMVTAGGISLAGINPQTMESLGHSGLYLIGEVLDVDGDTGGYNLQFAYSSARCAVAGIYGETFDKKGINKG